MFQTEHTLVADDGTEIEVALCHSTMEHDRAKELFDTGEQVGDWHWKHCTWTTTVEEWEELREAIEYFYGPLEAGYNLKIDYLENGGMQVEAFYGC